jgi:hypothetical protein
MSAGKAPIPLAFLLALGGGSSQARPVAPSGPDNALRPGELRNLLLDGLRVIGEPATPGKPYQPIPGRNAQFFPNFPNFPNFQNFPNFPNFNNCFTGNWRNC